MKLVLDMLHLLCLVYSHLTLANKLFKVLKKNVGGFLVVDYFHEK